MSAYLPYLVFEYYILLKQSSHTLILQTNQYAEIIVKKGFYSKNKVSFLVATFAEKYGDSFAGFLFKLDNFYTIR